MRARLLLLVGLAACGGTSGGSPGGGGQAALGQVRAPEPDALVGDYECRFTRGEVELEPATCAIRDGGDGQLRLEQPGGALRLTGSVAPEEAGFRLTGEVVCAGDPCPSPGTRDIVFFTQRAGTYAAVVPLPSGDLLNIDLTRR
ncbi:MAG TPA: hypothetical protein VFU21_03550 [Kofleriaceae bacterium]|nr:hypothetical protein [Kofleriaceae bacterium]